MFDYLLVLALFPRQENTQAIPLCNFYKTILAVQNLFFSINCTRKLHDRQQPNLCKRILSSTFKYTVEQP
jgi:hypothetical protein